MLIRNEASIESVLYRIGGEEAGTVTVPPSIGQAGAGSRPHLDRVMSSLCF